jgi:hypothetical protein
MFSVPVRFRVVHQYAQHSLGSILELSSLMANAVYRRLQDQIPPCSEPCFASEGWSHQAQDGQKSAMLLGACRDLPLV